MRTVYIAGAPGMSVSGLVWVTAAAIAKFYGTRAGIFTLFFAGMLIHPLSVAVSRALGRTGRHAKTNPLGSLALEGTVILLLGIALAFTVSQFSPDLFFAVMLVVIGGRYLTFQTLYGMRIYWVAGGVLAAAGLACLRTPVPAVQVAAVGGGLELVLSAVIFLSKEAGLRSNR